MMRALSVVSLLLTVSTTLAQQVVLDNIHNATALGGSTWSTGSGAVSTGPSSVNPLNMTFNYPQNTGRSFSFTDDLPDGGHWEQFDFRFTANASDPHCITGVLTWQHGSFQYLSNGSLLLTPFAEDGFQQVQDPCAAVSNQIISFNATILFSQWRIFELTPAGSGFHLHLFEQFGDPVAPMNIIAQPPNMLPTSTLKPSPSATPANVKREELEARNAATRLTTLAVGSVGVLAVLGSLVVLL